MLHVDFRTFVYLHRLMSFDAKPLPNELRSRLASHIALYLPEVASRIDESDFGVVHLEMGVLRLATKRAIDERQWGMVSTHFSFLEALIRQEPGDDIIEAIHVSYLGMLFDGEHAINYEKARQLLPQCLKQPLKSIELHYAQFASPALHL